MKTADQILQEWGLGPDLPVACTVAQLVRVIEAAMQAGVENAKESFLSKIDAGLNCPCCSQFAKRYRRKLHSTMAAGLIWLSRLGTDYVYVRETAPRWLLSKGGSFALLQHWGLIESKAQPSNDKSQKESGVWKITRKGTDYVNEQITVRARVILYNNKCEGFEGEQIWIKQALGGKFDYQELMSA